MFSSERSHAGYSWVYSTTSSRPGLRMLWEGAYPCVFPSSVTFKKIIDTQHQVFSSFDFY